MPAFAQKFREPIAGRPIRARIGDANRIEPE
jgi:hypothetical protein